ncbi:MAG TPA: PAS domain S-box protein [Steroidobacteraceae bacterium]|nr:PAS domain S-box protein [Steroidobacteraceae bacterium]
MSSYPLARIECEARTADALLTMGSGAELYRAVFEQLAVGVAHSTLDGRLLDANPKFCELLGYRREEMAGRGIRELTHADDIDRSVEGRASILAGTGPSYEYEVRLLRKGGEALWTRISTSLVRAADGTPAHFTSLVQDISQQKEAERQNLEIQERFLQLAENIREVLFLIDPTDGRTLYISPAYEAIWGQSTSEVYADWKAWMGAIVPDDLPGVEAALAAAVVTGHMDHEYRIRRPDHSLRWINGRTFPIRDGEGKITRLAGLAEDVTARKHAEQQIEGQVERLQRAMRSTIDVIATIGELRDPYTHGHEHRVGELAAAIAMEMHLDPGRVEGIRIAGFLHDVGKICVPAEILAKPTRLTPEEFNLIKVHPQTSYEILKGIEFPWPIAEIARQHHERVDGSGYPRGLKDQEILLEAKIVAVADAVEAMASHRPYRPGRGLEVALAEIEATKGTLYDAVVVDACVRLFRVKGMQLSMAR